MVIGLFADTGGPGVAGEFKLLENDGIDGWANDGDISKGRVEKAALNVDLLANQSQGNMRPTFSCAEPYTEYCVGRQLRTKFTTGYCQKSAFRRVDGRHEMLQQPIAPSGSNTGRRKTKPDRNSESWPSPSLLFCLHRLPHSPLSLIPLPSCRVERPARRPKYLVRAFCSRLLALHSTRIKSVQVCASPLHLAVFVHSQLREHSKWPLLLWLRTQRRLI